ncbi:hypothetical protein R4K48_09525 [Brachyspira pulli]|uniref:hypothetical protein n=1 Tax=Brachyspira pulli TaxID=310721 RepID=UPI003006F023
MLQKIFILILSITLISCKSPNTPDTPNKVIAVDGSQGNNNSEEIDPNNGNVKIILYNEYPHYAKDCLPLQVKIINSDNNEIPIGQLTTSDKEEGDSYTYSKIFTFTPGTYNLVLRSANGKEEIYKNLSFTAGQLESYSYQDNNNNQATLKVGYDSDDGYYVLPIDIFIKEENKNEIPLGQLYGGDDEVTIDYQEYGKVFYIKPGKYTLRLKSYGGSYEDQIYELNLVAGYTSKYLFIRK